MKQKRKIVLLAAAVFLPAFLMAVLLLVRQVRADVIPVNAQLVASGAATQPYGNLIPTSKTQTIAVAHVVSTLPSSRESALNFKYTCSVEDVSYEATQSAGWGAAPAGTTVTVNPDPATMQPSATNKFTISGNFQTAGYYKIDLIGGLSGSDGTNSYAASGLTLSLYVTVYKVDVVWNGADTLSGTDGSSTFATGAPVTGKTCYIAPGVKCVFTGSVSPSDLTTSGPQWVISGQKTIAFSVSPDESTGSPTYYPGSDLAQYTTDKFFWSDNTSGSKTVQFNVSINGSLQSATMHFTYELPTNIALNNNTLPAFVFQNQTLQFENNVNPAVWLSPQWTAPAHWALSVNNPAGESQQFVQLMQGLCRFHHPVVGTSSDYWVKLTPGDGLDSDYYYGNNTPTSPSGTYQVWSDAPHVNVYSDTVNHDGTPTVFPANDDQLILNWAFTTYWAYRPTSADADWVPLEKIRWKIGGDKELQLNQNPGVDANWATIIPPSAAFEDNGEVATWYLWTARAGNSEIPVKE